MVQWLNMPNNRTLESGSHAIYEQEEVAGRDAEQDRHDCTQQVGGTAQLDYNDRRSQTVDEDDRQGGKKR